MSNKILYSPKEGTTGFWGMRDVPEEPEYCTGFDDRYCELCQREAALSCNYKKQQYNAALESCKSNKLEIVNPEVIGVTEDSMNQCLHIKGKYLKPGDIFDLPSNYEFKEETLYSDGQDIPEIWSHVDDDDCIMSKKVLRLVKTETKDLLTFECKDENCPHCNFEREFSQPEPEESQTVLVDKLIKMVEATAPDYLKQSIMQSFTIQRKKQ